MSKEDRQDQAWKYREEGEPMKSLAINYGLLQGYEVEGNWEMVINVLVDVSITWSVLGRDTGEKLYFQAAVDTIRHTKHLSDTHKVPLRADYNFYLGRGLSDTEEYQESAGVLQEYLGQESNNLSEDQVAETEAHLGKALVNSGNKDEGVKMLRKSVDTLSGLPDGTSTHQGKDLTAIKRTGAKLKLASVTDDKTETRKLVEEVVKESEEKGLGAREKEAKLILKSLE